MPQQNPPLDKNSERYFRWAMLKEKGPEFFDIAALRAGHDTPIGDIVGDAVALSGLFVDAFVAQNGPPWATSSEVKDEPPY